MRGRIIKRGKPGKEHYTIVLSMELDPTTGKRKQQWIAVQGNKKDAERKLIELLGQLEKGTYVRPAKTSVANYLERWLADYAKPTLSPRSYERYADIVRRHFIPDFGNVLLTHLKIQHLQAHYSRALINGLSARTIRYHHAVIHRALHSALKWELVARNVADGAELPRIDHSDMQTWDIDEVNHFLEVAKDSPYFALFYTVLYTGCRRSELLGLRWKDVDPVFGQVSINRSLHYLRDGSYVITQPKSAKARRTIAMPPSLVLVLNEYRAHCERNGSATDDSLVFCHPSGVPYRPNTVTRAWTTLAARAGVKVIRFHDARHTHATLLLKQGIHPKIVQERLGHSTIAMTLDIYSHMAPGLQEAAAASFDKMLKNNLTEETVFASSH